MTKENLAMIKQYMASKYQSHEPDIASYYNNKYIAMLYGCDLINGAVKSGLDRINRKLFDQYTAQ